MESVEEPRSSRYRDILSLMDTLHGSEELAQLAESITSSLESSLRRANTTEK